MVTIWRHSRLAVLLLMGAFVAGGCNLPALTYFLMPQDSFYPPECEALKDPPREIKIAFLGYVGAETRPEFLRADRDVCDLLVQVLRKRYAESKTKITVVNPSEVEAFKDKNPDWRTMSIQKIGNYFKADFVINLDLDKLSLYPPKSNNNELLLGQAEISVQVFDVTKPGEYPTFRKVIPCTYPRTGPVPIFDVNENQFRSEFHCFMVKELARIFAPFRTDEKLQVDVR